MLIFTNENITDNNGYYANGEFNPFCPKTNRVTGNVLNYLMGKVTGTPYTMVEVQEYPIETDGYNYQVGDQIVDRYTVTGLDKEGYGGESLDVTILDDPDGEDMGFFKKLHLYKQYAEQIKDAEIGVEDNGITLKDASIYSFLTFTLLNDSPTSIQDSVGYKPKAFLKLTIDSKEMLVTFQERDGYDTIKFYNFYSLGDSISYMEKFYKEFSDLIENELAENDEPYEFLESLSYKLNEVMGEPKFKQVKLQNKELNPFYGIEWSCTMVLSNITYCSFKEMYPLPAKQELESVLTDTISQKGSYVPSIPLETIFEEGYIEPQDQEWYLRAIERRDEVLSEFE